MKILMLNYEYPPLGGGAAPMTAQLCEHLVEIGHTVDVITMRYKDLPHLEIRRGVRIFRTPSLRVRPDICRTFEMATYLIGGRKPALMLARQNQYDIIHAHFIFPTGPLALYLSRKTGIPCLITCHGSDVPGHNPSRFVVMHKILLPCWKKIVRSADALVCPSEDLRRKIMFICRDAAIKTIPNGIALDAFQNDKPRKTNILLCSRLLAFKGFQYVIEAVKELAIDWQVHIVGDGPYHDALKAQAKDSKTPIIFHGWLDRDSAAFKELYETSSIFILPSEAENFPTVLLEAMSAGLAVITSTAGGCPEVVGDAGLLVSPRDAQAIQQVLLQLIRDDELRGNLSVKALRQVDRFTWSAVADQYIALYRSVING